MKDKDFIKQQCNYCGHKSQMYGETILYVDPYGDVATNYICLECYTTQEKKEKKKEMTKCKPNKVDGNNYCTCDCGLHKENGDY